MNRERADLVIIGNGMAAARLVQELARLPGRPTRILMIGGEPRPAYNRVLLSSLLAGDVAADVLPMHDENWYQENNIAVRCHDRVVQLDPAQRCLRTAQGLHVSYTQLVLATGARATLPEVPGIALDGVMGFRTLEDVAIMQDVAARGGHAVVVGGGLLGLEAAEGLRKQGMHVTVIHRSAHLLNRQLDAGASGPVRVEDLHLLASDTILVATDQGLFVVHDGELEVLDSGIVARGDNSVSVAVSNDGDRWLGIDTRLYRNGELVLDSRSPITSIVLDHEGSLWIAADGLHRLKPAVFRTYGAADGAVTNVYPIHEDSEGRIWLGSLSEGIARYEDGAVQIIARGEGAPSLPQAILESCSVSTTQKGRCA